jgi:hypothetical protein
MTPRPHGAFSVPSYILTTGSFVARLRAVGRVSGNSKNSSPTLGYLICPCQYSGIEAAKWMTESDPTVAPILFTVLETEGIESEARRAGIRAIVSKSQVWKLLTSIETAIKQNSN